MSNERLKPIQERLRQQGERIANVAIERVKREVAVTFEEASAEIGQKLDDFFDQVVGELNSDLKGKQ
jgi:F0F1-type ATP synthase membrane subunit b/b'